MSFSAWVFWKIPKKMVQSIGDNFNVFMVFNSKSPKIINSNHINFALYSYQIPHLCISNAFRIRFIYLSNATIFVIWWNLMGCFGIFLWNTDGRDSALNVGVSAKIDSCNLWKLCHVMYVLKTKINCVSRKKKYIN